jgi:hypothetical protein
MTAQPRAALGRDQTILARLSNQVQNIHHKFMATCSDNDITMLLVSFVLVGLKKRRKAICKIMAQKSIYCGYDF